MESDPRRRGCETSASTSELVFMFDQTDRAGPPPQDNMAPFPISECELRDDVHFTTGFKTTQKKESMQSFMVFD